MTTYISNTDHYKEVLSRVQSVKQTLWIGTADIKDLYVRWASGTLAHGLQSNLCQNGFFSSSDARSGRCHSHTVPSWH